MPEHLRALVVILAIAAMVFVAVRKSAVTIVSEPGRVDHWRNLWFTVTLAAFFSHSYWVYIAALAVVLYFAKRHNSNHAALYFLLLMVIPSSSIAIPGFGVVNYLFNINHIRLLGLLLLLPAFLALRRQGDTLRFGRTTADKLLFAYLALTLILLFRHPASRPWSFTDDVAREAFYLFLELFLPYYVFSRAVKTLGQFKEVLLAFLLGAFVIAAIGIFESGTHWLLYNALTYSLGTDSHIGGYLSRSGILRASATTGQAIVLGYVMAVALGIYLFLTYYLSHRDRSSREGMDTDGGHKFSIISGGLLLVGGLLAPLSRGPWVGAAALVFFFVASGRQAFKRMALLGMAGFLSLALLAFLPGGDKLLDMLPFVGTVENKNIDYRQQLLINAMKVIERNPLFGSPDALATDEMEEMRQGQGIIDVVNSYIRIALEKGFAGVGLFLGFFVVILLGIHKTYSRLPPTDIELRLLGRMLFSTLIAILLIIFTVSSISFIPIIYWSIAGLGVAYIQMINGKKKAPVEELPLDPPQPIFRKKP